MGLTMGIAVRDEFVLLSSDSKISVETHDAQTFEKYDGTESIDFKHKRVWNISDKVLLTTDGIVHTGDIVKREIYKLVDKDSTLGDCVEALKKVTADLWDKRKPYADEANSDRDTLALNFLGTEHFSCVMFGFLSNGKTGVAYLDPGSMTVKVDETPMDHNTNGLIISPSLEDNTNYRSWITLPWEDQTLMNYVYQLFLTHAKLSLKHPQSVSSDCNFYALYKDYKGDIQTINEVNDTSLIYPLLKENEDIDHRKLYKIYKSKLIRL